MKKGFTLIELLIVVAIIAILAAIAVPNFLEAQVRAKVSRCKADIRSVITALELYKLDTNKYPTDAGGVGGINRPYGHNYPRPNFSLGFELSTPIAYLSGLSAFQDPFRTNRIAYYESQDSLKGRQNYAYTNHVLRSEVNPTNAALKAKIDLHGPWTLSAAGPDGFVNNGQGANNDFQLAGGGGTAFPLGRNYDATNGTVSAGDISRSPKYTEGWENPSTAF